MGALSLQSLGYCWKKEMSSVATEEKFNNF